LVGYFTAMMDKGLTRKEDRLLFGLVVVEDAAQTDAQTKGAKQTPLLQKPPIVVPGVLREQSCMYGIAIIIQVHFQQDYF
jgi:hypothetical protein